MRLMCSFDFRGGELSDVDVAERINDWLARWHGWCSREPYASGFYGVSPGCKQARSSRQYDDQNGGLDAHIDSVEMEAVDAVINAITDPWRTALAIQARNLNSGANVWRSPRLPASERERMVVLVEARKKFHLGLVRAGIF